MVRAGQRVVVAIEHSDRVSKVVDDV
jgi:hypothetical protein